jgi:purine-binding chemotaxis protein CheW
MNRQIMTCTIGQQCLGIDIMAIREIRAWTPATLLPHAPAFVEGVVNLRGVALPVIDLSERLGWGKNTPTERHAVVVVEMGAGLRGYVVDGVDDIVTFTSESLQSPPSLGGDVPAEYLEGLTSIEGRMVMVLSLSSLGDDSAGLELLAA